MSTKRNWSFFYNPEVQVERELLSINLAYNCKPSSQDVFKSRLRKILTVMSKKCHKVERELLSSLEILIHLLTWHLQRNCLTWQLSLTSNLRIRRRKISSNCLYLYFLTWLIFQCRIFNRILVGFWGEILILPVQLLPRFFSFAATVGKIYEKATAN